MTTTYSPMIWHIWYLYCSISCWTVLLFILQSIAVSKVLKIALSLLNLLAPCLRNSWTSFCCHADMAVKPIHSQWAESHFLCLKMCLSALYCTARALYPVLWHISGLGWGCQKQEELGCVAPSVLYVLKLVFDCFVWHFNYLLLQHILFEGSLMRGWPHTLQQSGW